MKQFTAIYAVHKKTAFIFLLFSIVFSEVVER